MMSLFQDLQTLKKDPKPPSFHPWQNRIKDEYSNQIKHAHNSIHNPVIPKIKTKEKAVCDNRIKFTVIGNRVNKDFIYCAHLVEGLYKYKSKQFKSPVVRGVSVVEWPDEWNKLKIRFKGDSFYLTSQVAVLINDEFLGGREELEEAVKKRYIYHLTPNYPKESVENFVRFVKGSGRPCAYLHISIDGEHIGTLTFMLYVDIAPRTCENFLRLCREKRGGYSGTPVHRIVKDSWIQCGGFGLKSVDLPCENFIVPHDRRGVLCMANADRDVDCSTQFFVLLQPQPWMEYKYVGFGQLIDGAAVLKKIEEVPTWYESPTQEVIIYHAGILTLDCQEIVVNPSAREYILCHIDDLEQVGRVFMEIIMDTVFLEIEFRILQLFEAKGEEQVDEPIDPQQQKDAQEDEIKKVTDDFDENNDFDVEMYEYDEYEGGEEFSVAPSTPAPPPPPERPFYLPLTDVPYPGEVDSTYNLLKFLRGNYCHENDLKQFKAEKSDNLYLPKHKIRKVSVLPPSRDGDLDSYEEEEIKRYIRCNVDNASFAGETLMHLAKTAYIDIRKPRKSRNKTPRNSHEKPVQSHETWIQKPEDFMRSGTYVVYPLEDENVEHQSVFAQLFDEMGPTSSDLPTLKNYKTFQEMQHHNILRFSKGENLLKAVDSKEKFSQHFTPMETLTLQYGKKLGRRISTDYAAAVDLVNRIHKVSIRTLEYAKTRPSMSVAAYKDRNEKLSANAKL